MAQPAPSTEGISDEFRAVETWPDAAVLEAIVDGQIRAVSAVRAAVPALARAAQLIAQAWREGGRIAYAGAGSSGLIALTDAVELPGTFGMARERLLVLLPGGADTIDHLDNSAEDDAEAGAHAAAPLRAGDVIIAVSASGATPYTLAAARAAKRQGAAVIAIACNSPAPLLEVADIPVAIETGSEIPAGSTRMNAGTAQKCALNMLSTLTAMRLNHVLDGMMVNLQADNAKLRERTLRIVAHAAAVDRTRARAALEATGGAVKPAILVARAAVTPQEARRLLDDSSGSVQDALLLARAETSSAAGGL